ncbi:molybdopterin-dependent oxidoreductase [Nitriliruptor alkaliphilus]|uniref:molybdopterin-dependent oxidoreductase n=1 Tax=Nitriliruptor alkaliphilus TaxID=427918 RepID=UPI0006981E11|nr:molybdopterin-dependent oxidoreductase [Nitriliruptor alkaliphilus]
MSRFEGRTRAWPARTAWLGALAGIAAVAVTLGTVELLAGTTTRVPSAVDAVSQQVIPRTPEGVTRWAIATFGARDIAVLNAGTTTIALALGAVTGVAARRRFVVAIVVFVLFAGLGLLASVARSEASFPLTLLVLTVGVTVGLAALHRWLRRSNVPAHAPEPLAAPPAPAASTSDGADRAPLTRRRFVGTLGGAVVAAVVAAAVGRSVLRGSLAVVDPGEVALPRPARALAATPPAARFDVDGLAPLFTPNDAFYVIDTAVAVPQVDPDTWTLRIHGAVDRELTLTYDELLALPLEEVDATLSCVSNEVGGDLIGNARWLGVRLADLLDRVGVQDGGEQVLGRSVDGFTAGFPTEVALDGRDAIVAVGMNGEPLPTRHGFPARLVVPGLYGYVSATKWLSEIELTGWDVDGYWIPRGWAKEGPIKTQSRIDVPRRGVTVTAGEVVVAGVAWAPVRGVARVEVRLDGGGWVDAERSEPVSESSWVQWRAVIPVDAGDHVVQVRATDGAGEVQPSEHRPPAPSGAEGWHRVTFRAS